MSRAARIYLAIVIVAGSATAISACVQLYSSHLPTDWLVLAALTLLTGSFTVRIPGLLARISVSDAFVFASVLLFGPAPATVIVAIDSVVATLWMRPENRSVLRSLFNLSAVALAIWIAASSFYWLADASPGEALPLSELFWPLFVLAGLYFLVNSALVAVALGFERHTNAVRLWWDTFPSFSLNYFGGVSVAALLVSQTREVDLAAISVILPLLAITYLTYRAALGRFEDAQRHIVQVNDLYLSTIEALALAVDAKDQITHGHIRRVQIYAVELAKRLGVHNDQDLKAIEVAALLHDMGKLAIPEHILNKPGKLTQAEFHKMKRHAAIGADLLSSVKFPYPVVPIVRHHHENWGGGGYPSGIAGTDIPLGARILSVVDCFDALTSDRPYRPRMTNEEAFTILRERRGVMYDPMVVDMFISVYDEIAPGAIRAGQEAKSLVSVDAFSASRLDTGLTLRQIRAGASEAAILAACDQALAATNSLVEATTSAAQALRQLTPATIFAIYRYDNGTDTLICESAFGDSLRLLDRLVIPVGERVTGWSAANLSAAINSDASLDLAQIAEAFEPPLRSVLCTPIAKADRLFGVLAGYSPRQGSFDEQHLYSFEHVARSLAAIIERGDAPASSVTPFRRMRR